MDNTVFIVDDDGSVRDSLGLLLGLRGYRTSLFADAASFLGALRADWQGCLIVDIRMPGMNGLELQRELLDRRCTLPVVVITSRLAEKHRRYAAEVGADHYLGKPYQEEELLALVARYARAGEA